VHVREKDNRILLTGATGYVGGRLLSRLAEDGYRIRCLVRQPDFLRQRLPAGADVVAGNALDRESLMQAMRGMDVAYYLIHSMASGDKFADLDRKAAENFAAAAEKSGLKRIIYLGGLAAENEKLADHMRSRQEVGALLRQGAVPVIEFRASVVIGSGSLSYEMIRSLVDKLPIMVTPRWVSVKAQPIAIEDLLSYLRQAVEIEVEGDQVYEIGGSEQLSYRDLMLTYAKARGLKRRMLPVPFLSPWLSSLWLGLVSPLYARVGRKLIDSIRHASVVNQPLPEGLFSVSVMSADKAIRLALHNEELAFAETRWFDAISSRRGQVETLGLMRHHSRLLDNSYIDVAADGPTVFHVISQIGGKNGWYAWNFLWQIRGFMDLLIGGVGMRRGRPQQRQLRPGDALDFWRVENFEEGNRLRLVAEMIVPGRAWLEFEVVALANGSQIRQTAIFYPNGLIGHLYWYAIYPLHALVFRDMLRGIARRAEALR
jgi:uncharacterized protein YbjT (DUF2867 family)